MRPSLSPVNPIYSVFTDAEIGSYTHGQFAAITTGADRPNIGIVKLGLMVILPLHAGTRASKVTLSSARNHVSRVVLCSPGAEMRRVAAKRRVAGMQYQHPVWDNPTRKNKRQAVCAPRPVFELHLTIPVIGDLPQPKPAFVGSRLCDLAPKALGAVCFTFESCHKLKIARRASARAISSADAENGKSVCVSSQTNSTKLPTRKESARWI